MLFISCPSQAKTRRSFEELRDAAMVAIEEGRLTDALGLCERALAQARERGAQDLVDLAVCNRSAVLITLGREREVMPELRQILLRSSDSKMCSVAAYDLSRAHERIKEYKKGLFYARIARDRALPTGREDLLVGSYNQIGNCLMSDSFFAAAAEEYQHAMELLPAERSVARGLVMANLGYCEMMQERVREGMSLSFQALRWFRSLGTRVYEAWPHLDLCYAYLELGRPMRAWRHGRRALLIAEAMGEAECVKNALFLLGETERTAGDLEAAHGYFSRLQTEFYADAPQVVELMVQLGLRKVVNLRA
ncbi:MAG: hypothetical protein AAF560_15575 [Acidobacteriota bacterium]